MDLTAAITWHLVIIMNFLAKACWSIITLSALQQCLGKERVLPIVDVRFDGAYRQINSSVGDNWTPTWCGDDVLYTGNGDGSNFGGIPDSPLAFGKLVGDDPNRLLGVTINRMRDYRGADGQLFRKVDGYTVSDVTYRLQECRDDSNELESICLVGPLGRKRLFLSKNFKSPSFATLNNAPTFFGATTGKYVFAVADAGLVGGVERYYVARVPISKLSEGNAMDWAFLDAYGSWSQSTGAAEAIYNEKPLAGSPNWKSLNVYCIDGALYMFITQLYAYEVSREPNGRMIMRNASIIKSTDKGLTWIRPEVENQRHPMFMGQRFGAPYFVWYGKDGAANVDRADRYVYAVSNDGYWESGDNYIVGRVLRDKLPDLSAADWTFYRSGDGMIDRNWTSDLTQAEVVLSDPGQAGMTGVTYIEALGRYVMVTWHYPSHGWRDVKKNSDEYTVLEFFDAPHPWGPWARFKSLKAEAQGFYTPIIGQRFQTSLSSSTVKAILYASSQSTVDHSCWLQFDEIDRAHYKVNYIPITLSTDSLKHYDALSVQPR